MKNIINIMKYDLTAMKAKKFSLGKIFVAALILSAVSGLFVPYLMLPLMIAFGFIAVPSFVDVEDRNEGEMTFSILPVTRKETVIARYGLVTLALTITGAISLLVLNISHIISPSEDSFVEEMTSGKIDETGILSLLICIFLAVALIFSAAQLSGFFKTGKNKSGRSMLRLVFVFFILWLVFGIIFVIELASLEVKILNTAVSIAASLLSALASPYNGALLCIFILITAYGFVFYKAACSVIDYEAREL